MRVERDLDGSAGPQPFVAVFFSILRGECSITGCYSRNHFIKSAFTAGSLYTCFRAVIRLAYIARSYELQ